MRVAVVTVLLLSGCAAPSATPADQDPHAGPILVGEGLALDPGLGGINGTVVQSGGAPMPGARVSVLGTSAFARTDDRGRFLFLNLTPGDLVVDVRAEGFTRVEQPVRLEAGRLADIRVVLVPDFGQAPGQAAHVHDWWHGATEVVLMDEAVDMTKRPTPDQGTPGYEHVAQHVLRPMTSNDGWGPVPIPDSSERPPTVLPGTRQIEVTLQWDTTQVTKQKLGLGYVSAAGGSMVRLPAQQSGQAWQIELTPDMTDSGHQSFSFWEFYILYNSQEERGPVLGQVHVRIVLLKADVLPFDPPHEDFWQGRESILVVEDRKIITGDAADRTSMQSRPEKGVLVPPGTTHLLIEFNWTFQQVVESVRHPDGYHAIWRSADMDRTRTPLASYHSAAPIVDKEGHRVYLVELEPQQTDQYYQRKSNWAWTFAAPGEEDQTYDRGLPNRTVFELRATALRGAAVAAAEAAVS